MCPYIDLQVVSVVHEYTLHHVPRSFAVLTGWVPNSDDHKCGFISIITFNQSKCSLCEQTLAGLVLNSTQSAWTWFADGDRTNQLGKIKLDTPLVIFEAEFPFFRMSEHPKQEKSLSSSPKKLLR